jgi:hypothetical protein
LILSQKNPNYYYTKNFKKAAETYYYTGDKSQYYYFANDTVTRTFYDPVINFELAYDTNAPRTLTVRTGTGGALSGYAFYREGANTTITPNEPSAGGFTVRQITANGDGTSTITVTVYNRFRRRAHRAEHTTQGLNDVDLSNGMVTHSLSGTGSLSLSLARTFTAEDFIVTASVKLKSEPAPTSPSDLETAKQT